MTTIYRKSASRLTVAEAKRLVCEAVPKEPAVDFFVAPDGSIKVELNHEANTAAPFINPRFIDACSKLGINPRMTHIPTITGYTGEGIYQDLMYSITHDEFVRYADLHGVAVTVGDAPSVGQAQPEPAPAPATAALVEQPQGAAQVEPVQAAPAQRTEMPTPVTEKTVSNAPAWAANNPQRYKGYTAPLHRLLVAAHREGKPRPTARDVLEAWRINMPAEIAKVLPDGFDYYDSKGNTKAADLTAIRKAIGRMTSAR